MKAGCLKPGRLYLNGDEVVILVEIEDIAGWGTTVVYEYVDNSKFPDKYYTLLKAAAKNWKPLDEHIVWEDIQEKEGEEE